MDKNKTIVIKYGGNAMTNETIQNQIIKKIVKLKSEGNKIVLVHGGGPFIQNALDKAGLKSEFIAGQRKTSKQAIIEVEKALKGEVNGHLVSLFNQHGTKAIGLSGKDAQLVVAQKRYHKQSENGLTEYQDLGQVGNVKTVKSDFIESLLNQGITPVITCIADDAKGLTFNINADVFAGSIAGALNADELLVLTDVDGLLMDKDDANSLIETANFQKIASLIENEVIKGGMIPKVESCQIAIKKGAKKARIINGTKPEQLQQATKSQQVGTTITL
jgi:acetylglutamate kinase